MKGDVKDNIAYADETTVIFPAGNNVVLHHLESKTQQFVPGTPGAKGVDAIAVSANKKWLAVAESAEKAQITIYDLHTLKRKKVLTTTEVGSEVRSTRRRGATAPRAFVRPSRNRATGVVLPRLQLVSLPRLDRRSL